MGTEYSKGDGSIYCYDQLEECIGNFVAEIFLFNI